MANPVAVTCTEGSWTLVASNVVTGWLRKLESAGAFSFHWTSRDTGDTAPSNSDETDNGLALPLFEYNRNEEIACVNTQDFYVWVKNADDDSTDTVEIRVDL